MRIASGADALRQFLPKAVSHYRTEHPAVTFDLQRCYGEDAEARLDSLDADIALIFEPIRMAHVHVAHTVHVGQPRHVHAPPCHAPARHAMQSGIEGLFLPAQARMRAKNGLAPSILLET